MADGDSNNRWWHALAFTAAASAGTFIASHWGGVTHDDLTEQLRKEKSEISESIDAKLTQQHISTKGDFDQLKAYLDGQLSRMEGRLAAPKKKHKETSGQ